MKKPAVCAAFVVASIAIVAGGLFAGSIDRWVYYPFDTNYKALPDSGSSSWYLLNFDDSGWPQAIASQDVEQFPNLLPQNYASPRSYFRGELNFTYRDIAPGRITAVYVWMWANTGFDLWFNSTYVGGEHAWPAGPPMVFDVTSLFSPGGKNVVAVRSEVLYSSGSPIHGTVIIEYNMPTSAVQTQPEIPGRPFLEGNSPNPSTSGTQFSFRTDVIESVVLTIYNVQGQIVRDLPQGRIPAGEHSVAWDGRDNLGRQVASGTYLYELRVGNMSEARKAIVLH